MIKAIIFDMDGLMIDSERVTFNGYKKVMNEINYSISEDFYKSLLGKTIKTGCQMFKNEYGEDFPFEQVLEDVHKYMADLFDTEGVPLKKGLVELLEYLKENQYKTIVATSSNRDRVNHILKIADIENYFDDSICGNEVVNGKPNPEIFLKACQKLGVLPENAIVLEDSEAGIQAAFAANIPVICIPDMKYPEPYFEKMTTDIYNSLDQVIDFLKANH